MELIPNSIYNNPSLAGGIRVSHFDILRIFNDFERVIKVKRSEIIVPLKKLTGKVHKYKCYEPEIIVKINGTRVRVRGLARDTSSVWVYDLQSDEFITKIKEYIAPYGDVASVSQKDINKRMAHAQKLKKIKKFLNDGSIANDAAVGELQEDIGSYEELEILL
jgi:hypothetical protein